MERQLQPFADCVEPRHHIPHAARLRFDAVDCAERIRRALRPAYELCVLRPQMRRCNEIDRTLLRCHIPYSCFALSPVTQYTHHSPRGIHLRAHIYRFPTPQPLLLLLLLRKKGQNRPSNCPKLRRLEYARRHSAYLRKKGQNGRPTVPNYADCLHNYSAHRRRHVRTNAHAHGYGTIQHAPCRTCYDSTRSRDISHRQRKPNPHTQHITRCRR